VANIVCIVGKSGSGKTTLIEKLIPELRRRGYRIGTVKHAAHHVDMDKKGKDSWRHRQAGADTVVVASNDTIAMTKSANSPRLEELALYFGDVDLVIVEGFKSGSFPKIEIFRPEAHETPLSLTDPMLQAMVTDAPLDTPLPRLALNDIQALADLVEQRFIDVPAAGAAGGHPKASNPKPNLPDHR
jgi:molybdopterin-guanine dinucleotide biosynthesis protein B